MFEGLWSSPSLATILPLPKGVWFPIIRHIHLDKWYHCFELDHGELSPLQNLRGQSSLKHHWLLESWLLESHQQFWESGRLYLTWYVPFWTADSRIVVEWVKVTTTRNSSVAYSTAQTQVNKRVRVTHVARNIACEYQTRACDIALTQVETHEH